MARDHDDHAPLLQGVPSCGQVVYHLLSLLRWYWVRLTVTMDPDRGSNSDIRHVNRSDIFPFKFKDIAPNFEDADIFFGDPKIIADTLYKWTALKTSIDGLTVVQKFRWPLTGQLQLWWVKVPFLMLIKTYKNPWLELCGFFFLNSKFWNGQTSVHDTSMAKDVVYPGLHLPWCLHGLCPTLVWELGACRIPTCAGKHTLEIKEHSWKLRKRSCEVRVRCTCFVFDIFDFCPITNHLWHPVTVRCEVFTFCFEDRLWSTLYSPDTQQYTCIQRLSNVSGCNLEHRALKWR